MSYSRLPVPGRARSALAAVVLGPFLSSLSGCGGGQPPPPAADPCNDVELQVERVWSADVKAQVLGYGGGVEATERQSVANKMDSISEDWVRLRLAVCNDFHKRKLITQDEYQRQVKCFDDRLDQQRRLVTMLKSDAAGAGKLATELLGVPNACK